MMHGFTENYVKVRAKYDPMLVNELTKVVLSAIIDGEPMLVDVTAVEEVLQH
jgi:threonylcarbamoyladenosine tRNA methylthiotransferase MtaB